jgi:type IV fimbrial biogenesis protein FimT
VFCEATVAAAEPSPLPHGDAPQIRHAPKTPLLIWCIAVLIGGAFASMKINQTSWHNARAVHKLLSAAARPTNITLLCRPIYSLAGTAITLVGIFFVHTLHVGDIHTTQGLLRRERAVASGTSIQTRASRGFTLVELMVTIAVVAILLSVALPAMQSFLQNDRQLTQANTLWMSLNLARSEARKQDVSVSVCPSNDGLTCSGSASWAQGWIVLSTAPGTTAPAMTIPAMATGSTLTEATPLATVIFFSNGMTSSAAAFTLCDRRGAAQARSIEVTLAGRVAAATVPGKRLDGTALVCP